MDDDSRSTIDESSEDTRYPGGKGTIFQRIINLMPPHKHYIETHVGGGAVIRNKRAANINVALDPDPKVAKKFTNGKYPHIIFYQADAIRYLEGIVPSQDILIYSDPPYMLEARTKKKIYDHEYSVDDHERLLTVLKTLSPCNIIISGYWTKLYQDALDNWNHISFEVMTRGGMATEYLWFNFNPPYRGGELHEYTYLGDTFRDRERIRKKQRRWIANLKKMNRLERLAMLELIRKEFA